VFVGVAIVLVGCTDDDAATEPAPPSTRNGATSVPTDSAIEALRSRSLNLPTLTDGEPCPVTTVWTSPSTDLGPLLGDGPARVGLGNVDGAATLTIAPAANFGSTEWGGNKVLWALDASNEGPALIRGKELGGPNEVRFNGGAEPSRELVLDPTVRSTPLEGGWIDFPASMRVRTPGCYILQIDTESGTTTLIFEAVPQPGT
jgi:hypothetical protein